MEYLQIKVTYTNLITKIKQHLAVIGKRAKTVEGNPLFSDLTTSSQEDTVIWNDLCNGGAEIVVANLAQLSGSYRTTNTDIIFTVRNARATNDIGDLKKALAGAIETFIWNYAIKEYLSIIHPGTGAKYPPIWANPYEQRMQYQLKAITTLAYQKRSPNEAYDSYNEVTGEVIENEKELEEKEREIDYENPFDFIEEHHHRNGKGRNIHKGGNRQKHSGWSNSRFIQ